MLKKGQIYQYRSSIPETEVESMCEDIENLIFFRAYELGNLDSFLDEDIYKLIDDIRNIRLKYQRILNQSNYFWQTPLRQRSDCDQAMCAIIQDLFDELEKFEKLKIFCQEVDFFPRKSLLDILKIIKLGDDIMQSYNIGGLLMISKFSKSNIRATWNFWFNDSRIKIYSLESMGWKNFIFEKIVNCKFIMEYLQFLCPNSIDLVNNIGESLNKTYISTTPPETHGFTTYDLYIYLEIKQENDILDKAATLIIWLHELSHYLRRCNTETLGDSKRVKSAELNASEGIDTCGEGGYDLEKYIFGVPVPWINEPAANFLINENYPTQLDDFKKAFNSKNESREYKTRGLLRGSHKNYRFLGECGHLRLYRR